MKDIIPRYKNRERLSRAQKKRGGILTACPWSPRLRKLSGSTSKGDKKIRRRAVYRASGQREPLKWSIAYTAGIIFYRHKKIPWHHFFIWHLFVLAGQCASLYFDILFYSSDKSELLTIVGQSEPNKDSTEREREVIEF